MSQPTQQEEFIAEDAHPRPPGASLRAGSQGLSQGQIVRKRFLGHSGAITGLFVFAFIFLLAFTSVDWAGHSGPVETRPLMCRRRSTTAFHLLALAAGLGRHPFGQDRIGRDLFAMTMRGAQQSITITILSGPSPAYLARWSAPSPGTSAAGPRPS